MKYLAVLLALANGLIDKITKADIEKATIKANASVEQASINAIKDKYIAGIAVTGAVIVTGMVTNVICKIKEGQDHE